jgi:signal transduction histidine kinase
MAMRVVDRFRGRLEASLAQLGITLPWWIPACTRSASAVFTVVTVVQHGDQLPSAPVLVAGLIALAPLLFWAATRRALPQWLDAATTVTALAILLAHPIPADFCVVLPIIMAAELAATARPVVAVTASLAAMAVFVAAQAWGRMTGYQVDVGGVIFALCAGAALRWYVRALDAERGKQDIAREQAMLAERQRIAREVHDVVAHSLTITLLHVTGARRALQQDRDVDEAVEALVDAEKAGRAAMADIRRTVGLLAPSPTGTHALPGIDDITALVERTKAAGLDVRYDRSGDLASVGDSVGLGLYRIAQESLANIAKHAPHATARMELTVGGAGTRLTVRNSLAGPVAERPPGSGLAGMTARADQLGARLDVGPQNGSWVVDVLIPVEAA